MFALRSLAQPGSDWSGQSGITDARTNGPAWWNQFFNGVLASEKAGATLEIPFRGTTVGLLYAMQPGFGTFLVSVDGGLPQRFATGVRDGYESKLIAKDLSPGEHRLTLVLPPSTDGKVAPVKLGALLVAGASQVKSTAKPVPSGAYSASVLRGLKFDPVVLSGWRVAGPYGVGQTSPEGNLSTDFETQYAPELNDQTVAWKNVPSAANAEATTDGSLLNFVTPGQPTRGVFYATTTIDSANGGPAMLQITLDYFAKIWLNGRKIKVIRDSHGHPRSPILFPATLRPGQNQLLIKLHPGSGGADLSMAVSEVPH